MFKTRLAPTPSGYLHLGNACNFVLSWLWTRSENGSLMLRIDDLDRSRKRAEYVEDIFHTLDWLGLDYDEGPEGPTDFEENWSQYTRLDAYNAALESLKEQKLLFACDCSRSQIQRFSYNGLYSGRCRERMLAYDRAKVAWRIRTPEKYSVQWEDRLRGTQNLRLAELMPDFVVRRKDQIPAYQIASVVDDVLFQTTAILRGKDLIGSTAAQIWLSQHLSVDFGQIAWAHHSLIRNNDGSKLSKSRGSLSIQAIRQNAGKPQLVYDRCAKILGLKGKNWDMPSLLEAHLQTPKLTSEP
ncbi:MAG: glutamate--tRNA ligase family protein [Bacteroidota bacterium]